MKIFLILLALGALMFFTLGLLSQKGKAPGLVDGKLVEPGMKPNVVCSEVGVQPERAVAPLQASLAEAEAAVIATGGTITAKTDSYIAATYMSKLFKFVDDVELRADGDVVHIRSGSRVGYSDNGVNRKRVETIRAYLQSNGAAGA